MTGHSSFAWDPYPRFDPDVSPEAHEPGTRGYLLAQSREWMWGRLAGGLTAGQNGGGGGGQGMLAAATVDPDQADDDGDVDEAEDDPYAGWTIGELRAELRQRDQPTTGRKATLIARLRGG